MKFAALTSFSVILTGLASAVAAGNATQASCPTNPDPGIWHVRFGIDATRADGSRIRPIGNLADAVRCADEGTTIQVLHSKSGPLMGGVVLKDRQKLLGEYDREGEGYPRIEATQGDALVLANENELGWLQIDANDGAAVFGGNVTGSFLHDLIINRLQASQMKRLDPSLCKPIIKDGKIDFADSVFRGCNGRLKPWQKAAITLVSDGKGGFPDFHHRLRNIRIRDIPTEEKRNQWDSGIKVVVAGIASVTVWIEDSYLSGMEMGIDGRARQKGSINLNVLNRFISTNY